MSKPKVYTAGPITGTSYSECTNWRDDVKTHLNEFGIEVFSPMRSKQYLLQETNIGDSYEETIMSSQRGIYARDHHDCKTCDLILINLLNAERVSIGTVMEIAWGAAYGKPMVLVMEENNLHDHSMLREACPFITDNLEDALDIVTTILLP